VGALAGLASVAAAEGQAVRALHVAGASAAVGATAELRLPEREREALEQALRAGALDDRATEAAWAEGQALTLEQAVAYALGKLAAA
jgi:hypothetical protein